MSSVGERLKNLWLAQGMPPRSGATEKQLRRFESRYGVRLPPDMSDYFAVVDGMDDTWSWDEDHFSFCPLGRVKRASEKYADQFLKDQSSYFEFADYLLGSTGYAIHLTTRGGQDSLVLGIQVLGITSCNRQYEVGIMADSFSEFAERYLADDDSRINLGTGLPTRGASAKHKVLMHPIVDPAHPLWDRDIDP
jgi:SMI1 / KNR4 family (SUKH-1)